ncbi:unnamed protein product [Pedinophyceae sp. YPF-701]|nr:unnamed protein product [Pedinophyceae sp. YPF-701]
MRWTRVTLAPSNEVVPAPRSGHAAVCLPDSRHVAIFGGGSVSRCLDELWILDTEVWVWILVEQEGDPPSARAGHADVLVDGYWAIIGGGDNDGGCRDVSAVNVDDLLRPTDDGGALAVWERACILNPDSHLACEGQTVCAWTSGSSIVAFGGYDGSYRNSAMILKLRGQNQADVPERGEQESVASDPSRNGHEERGASQVESPVAGDGSNEDVTSLKAALKDEQDQKLALKQKVAELERRVEELSGLEVELERHRSMIEIMQRKIQEEESHPRAASARSIWSIISGQN